MESNQQSSFWQFSDQLRFQNPNVSNLSLNDSIWSINSFSNNKKPEERRNFDFRVGGEINNRNSNNSINSSSTNNIAESPVNEFLKPQKGNLGSDFNSYNNDGWKIGSGFGSGVAQKSVAQDGGFNKGLYSKPMSHFYNNINVSGSGSGNFKGYYKNFNGKVADDDANGHGGKVNRKNKETKKESVNNKDPNGENSKVGVEKRFKSLPPSEALPRNEAVGGYIFVCNNDTMEENLRRQLFGLPPRYRDSVRAITPGLPLFLYNYSTHQLHGIYEAASFGGTNIDPTAWEDKKNHGESRFPAQVKVQTRKVCVPLDEDAFRPILHHYDGPKFRLELNVPEAVSLLDIFEEHDA
ncbi:hypothetical protein Dimus_030611 [Dionaea muscipula]